MPHRPTSAQIDLQAIAHNHRLAVELGGRPAVGVVKADAYGHGAVPVARALLEAGAPFLAVALVEEALELREAGLEAPILVLGGAYDGAWEAMARRDLTPLVFTPRHVELLAEAARRAGVRARAHLKLDTGMGRVGVLPEGLAAAAEAFKAHPEVELEGACTHFASADAEPRATTDRQVERFVAALTALAAGGLSPRWRHVANSAGTLSFPGGWQNLTRPGIMLYGYLPFDPGAPVPEPARAAGDAPAPRALLAHRHHAPEAGAGRHARLLRWALGDAAPLAHRHAAGGLRRRLLPPPLGAPRHGARRGAGGGRGGARWRAPCAWT